MELDEPVPPAPAEATKAQPTAVVLHNAPEPQKIDRPAAPVSTLAQLNAITKDTPCVLLHCAPGGELKDVATGMIIQPKSTTLHTVAMDANVLKVTWVECCRGAKTWTPPIQPEGADEHLTLENYHGYTMVWPKTQIRLGGRSTGASSIVRPPPRRPAAPPVVTATTSRHKKLLGESLPQPPPAEPKGKAAAPLSPIPSPNEDDIDDDGPVDVNAYLNTGADIDDLYMAGADEEPFRARDEQAGPPKATKQRLVFRGFSEETPPAADTQEPTAANIFSPNTLLKKVNEQFEASGAVAPKKPRKRPKCMKLANQYWVRSCNLAGDMLPLQDSIQVLENILLKDKDPNYPVFAVRVPRDVGFVTDAPADIFFIAYEDIFKLFHSRRLDYNLVRLFALNLAMKIKRESTPDVAIADPYYMRESQLALSAVRVRASFYLQKCFLDNKRKDNILLAYFPEDTYYVLISIAPKYSLATYFDSGSAKKKNYARIRGVLDDALEGYFKKGGAFKEKEECFRDDEMPTYVVYKGRVPGVYEEWQDCLEQVHKFSGNSYKGYATREEAVAHFLPTGIQEEDWEADDSHEEEGKAVTDDGHEKEEEEEEAKEAAAAKKEERDRAKAQPASTDDDERDTSSSDESNDIGSSEDVTCRKRLREDDEAGPSKNK
ncbi:hypothetical protein QYE76_001721 [Lolium multiflorum]|uniref:Uncharacterized protein n=1 Tax=Lolium multiflorum TaxID=4521 RepID=A0AAD8VZY6_LOLMU|nr:hypothetical protein QYE76_001721 [Lolium multiflorum]